MQKLNGNFLFPIFKGIYGQNNIKRNYSTVEEAKKKQIYVWIWQYRKRWRKAKKYKKAFQDVLALEERPIRPLP